MNQNNCPFCHQKIGYFRKLLFFGNLYSHPCPHCGKELKLKNIGFFWGMIIFILIFTILFIFPEGTFTPVKKSLPFVYLAFGLVGTYFLKFIPAHPDGED